MSQDGAQGPYEGRSVGGGRYQLRDLLGEGGMAAVHLAYDSVLDREVAIKTLHSELGREQAFRERFRREAQSVAKLAHTNIVSVFDSGEDELDGAMVPYIVMEYVSGQPLRSELDGDMAQHGAMPTQKALKITADVLAALEVSHEMGLVHRDIKPGNVMLTKRNVVKVMDFGIARAMQSGVTSMTQTGMVVGTPQYLSPEQALGRGVDARSDLYSVGIMLFELLTGQLPFDADSPLAIAYAHVQEEPPLPSSINQSVPPAVDALVARALKKNPNERFPTAEAMRDECLRIAGSAQSGGSPLIISEGPRARTSGSSVSSAVFPSATGTPHTPAPPHVQQPYQPTQTAGFGPSTPPPVNNAFPTPAPGPAPYHAGGYPTPAPAPAPFTPPPVAPTMPPANGPRPRKNNTPVVVVATIVGVVVVTAIAIAIGLSAGNGNGKSSTSDESTSAYSAPEPTSPKVSTRPEDKSATVQASLCTNPSHPYGEKRKIYVPSFLFRNMDSVKECMDAAGWKYTVKEVNEVLWGKNTVTKQEPSGFSSWDPDSGQPLEITVSTGRSD
ncbi:protein kinase domain-containing protein [Streptomyces benahoarensis]|uniref:non-specific serine/threonine protein kinase n=1 Tax=Streptomyces benahoarensis TaxID=2595054 RepID=A0A553ZL98_9ACTN|nr:protein kinase [Streptomyces benahoarensis]TSB22989.1 serine/threonine protein kinase [Streptomyces benahoarensis]TSB42259.1 serine/threonine protein kinase [Streptomyces benahoarensis]